MVKESVGRVGAAGLIRPPEADGDVDSGGRSTSACRCISCHLKLCPDRALLSMAERAMDVMTRKYDPAQRTRTPVPSGSSGGGATRRRLRARRKNEASGLV